ncbi:MAG: hypothetical protein Q7S12_04270 [bacterium]|nr:hypothetical protein [bacterium]
MKFKPLPFWEGFRNGLLLFIFGYIIWLTFYFVETKFLNTTEWLRELIIYFTNLEAIIKSVSLRTFVSAIISLFFLLPVLWLVGHIKIKSVIDHASKVLGRIFRRKKESRFLFCIRMKDKSFFGGYPIGFVTQIIIKKDGKKYYHTWWPGLMHWTLPFVPEEDVERCEESVREVLSIYISAGTVSL